MMTTNTNASKFLIALSILFACGCKTETDEVSNQNEIVVMTGPPPELEGDDHAGHAHPEHGPNGGELIELGKEDYHAEMIHDDQSVQLHILDSTASEPVFISAEKLTIGLKSNDAALSFDLLAAPTDSSPKGKTSVFTSDDEQLIRELDAGSEGVVTIPIAGKFFSGKLVHDHDHAH